MNAVNETQEKIWDMEYFKNQFEAQKSTLENIEMENVRLTQRLHENLEEMKSVMKERDNLKLERDQLQANLQETIARVSCALSTYPSKCVLHTRSFLLTTLLVKMWML